MNIKISDEAMDAARSAALERWQTGSSDTTQMLLSVFAGLEAAVPHLPRFTYTEEDLLQLARGVVPEWLKFDADAALDEELSK